MVKMAWVAARSAGFAEESIYALIILTIGSGRFALTDRKPFILYQSSVVELWQRCPRVSITGIAEGRVTDSTISRAGGSRTTRLSRLRGSSPEELGSSGSSSLRPYA